VGKTAVVVAIFAAAFTFIGTASPWSRQASLEQKATALTSMRPAIVCETPLEHTQGVKAGKTVYYGFTLATHPKLVVLSPSICRSLAKRDLSSPDFALAVYVLAHELGHVVRDTTNETAAECYALEHWRSLGTLFGLSAPTESQVATVAAAHDRLPLRYRGACPGAGA
jgi:hypothetical protein